MPKYVRYESLVDRVVFITGGGSGIGSDIVRAFRDIDARVAFVDVLRDESEALAAEVGATFIHCDIADTRALAEAIERTRLDLGPIGVLVNNAGNDSRHEIDDVSSEYWNQSMNINLKPFFFAAQAVRPQMRGLGGGSIINFSSVSWRVGGANMAVYATAKAGILGLTRALARGFGDDNIRVNAIEPGAVITERQRRLWYKTQEEVDAIIERQTIKRMLVGEDIAKVVLFLAADDSAMITRQSIIVDAGLS